MKSVFGYNPFGYWAFHSSDHAAEAIEKSWDACFSLYFPADPSLWKEHFCPEGQMEKWLARNEPGPLPAYLTETVCTVCSHMGSR
jgi:soluble epoxide hydrolase/lipid-phosphate phosphatase